MVKIIKEGEILFTAGNVFDLPEEGDIFSLEGISYIVTKVEQLFMCGKVINVNVNIREQ